AVVRNHVVWRARHPCGGRVTVLSSSGGLTMRNVRRLFGAAALLAAFGLLALVGTGGSSRAEEKKNEKETPKLTEAGQAGKDMATAYDLIEYGRRKKDPK